MATVVAVDPILSVPPDLFFFFVTRSLTDVRAPCTTARVSCHWFSHNFHLPLRFGAGQADSEDFAQLCSAPALSFASGNQGIGPCLRMESATYCGSDSLSLNVSVIPRPRLSRYTYSTRLRVMRSGFTMSTVSVTGRRIDARSFEAIKFFLYHSTMAERTPFVSAAALLRFKTRSTFLLDLMESFPTRHHAPCRLKGRYQQARDLYRPCEQTMPQCMSRVIGQNETLG